MQMLATIASFLFAFAGMMALSLAMDRHYEQLTKEREVPAVRRRLARLVGWLLLLVSITLVIHAWSVSAGLTFWCAIITLAALVVACGMTYMPRLTTASGLVFFPLGILGGLLYLLT